MRFVAVRTINKISSAAAAVTLLAACAIADSDSLPIANTAMLSVINAATTTFDVQVDNVPYVTAVQVGAVSHAVAIPSGIHQIRLITRDGTSPIVDVNARAGTFVTAVAFRAGATGINAAVLTDTGSLVPAGKSKLRVVHLSENAGAIEIWRTQPDFQTPVHIMTPFVYKAESPYLQSDPGNWEVFVTMAGSTTKLTSTGLIAIPSGQRRTVVLLDSAGNKLFRVLPD